MLHKLTFFCLFYLSLFGAEDVYLKMPNISRENVIGTTVGIRPHRKTGIRLEAERLKNKLIIHNYGYGGSGLTLAFGGSKEVLDIVEREVPLDKTIAVLGAGVAGLTTAYDLLKSGYNVHLYAETWNPDLTSNVAAGAWTPHPIPSDISSEKKELNNQILQAAEQRFLNSLSNTPEFAGVRYLTGYQFTSDSAANDLVTIHFDNGVIKTAKKVQRISLDGKLFMEDLHTKVQNNGAILIQRHFQTLDEILGLEEAVIINCMSLGSRELFNDQEFVPSRGQMIYYPSQEIDYLLHQVIPDSHYFFLLFPWNDRLILGGVQESGIEDLSTTPEVIDQLILNAKECLL